MCLYLAIRQISQSDSILYSSHKKWKIYNKIITYMLIVIPRKYFKWDSPVTHKKKKDKYELNASYLKYIFQIFYSSYSSRKLISR